MSNVQVVLQITSKKVSYAWTETGRDRIHGGRDDRMTADLTDRLAGAASVPALLAVAYEAFEHILRALRDTEDQAGVLLPAIVLAAAAAGVAGTPSPRLHGCLRCPNRWNRRFQRAARSRSLMRRQL
jgi:hypothetical protein